jgi:capsular polysaccharide biosynthesis protein
VLLTAQGGGRWLGRVAGSDGAGVHELDPCAEPNLTVRLAALRADVLVLDRIRGMDRGHLLSEVVHLVRPGGVLLVRDLGPEEHDLSDLLGTWLAERASTDPEPVQTVVKGVQVERFGRHARVVPERPAYLKLREEWTNDYLDLVGPGAGRVVLTRPPVRLRSRARVRQNGPSPRPLPRRYDVPGLSLREYDDVLCLPGQVAVQDGVLLPDSFRHNQRRVLGNKRLVTVTKDFAVPEEIDAPVQDLAGTYFYLDSSYRGHFGHAMTEQLSRLWAWERAKELFPDLRPLLLEERRTGIFGFEPELYSAAGVPPDDLVLAPGPVRVERLVAATPMFSQPEYVHPGIAEVWSRVSDALDSRAGEGPFPTRFFCARRHGKRACRNREEVEALFAEYGFTILYPEEYSLADQARMFRRAEAVGGYAGSALFNLLFSTQPTKVVMLASRSYDAQNEYMIASVLGHDMTIGWCRPVRRKPDRPGHDERYFQSPFVFRPEREGRLVRKVLEEL